jgi:hypothetical protein
MTIALLGPFLTACFVLAFAVQQACSEPVYAVSQVYAGLARDPGSWTDRTFRVRGVALIASCNPDFKCGPQSLIVDEDPAQASSWLPLALHTSQSGLSYLRQIPILGRFVPQARVIRWGVLATYRARLRAAPCAHIGPACYEVVVQASEW